MVTVLVMASMWGYMCQKVLLYVFRSGNGGCLKKKKEVKQRSKKEGVVVGEFSKSLY